ncbi:RNA-binding S4 domain-containing protein [Devosia sp.]|uniref:RNA-binding S4 domain-containing protein n=1 Tax=Devosia sp. TaxID=1871048 RepID=UPI0032633054
MSGSAKERLDKFLFFSRAIKSRTLAQKLIETGVVRVNGERTTATDHKVGSGDVLTMTIHERIVVWKIVSPGTRRGPATEAATLYQDLSPPPLPREERSAFDMAIGKRDAGAGRPTKKERRETDGLRDDRDD